MGSAARPTGVGLIASRRRLAWALAVLIVAGSLISLPGRAAAAAAAKRHAASDLLINAQDWSVWPSRGRLPAGTVYVELWNRGEDPHVAWIRRLNRRGRMVGPVLAEMPLTLPGAVTQAVWHLRAGRYELSGSFPGHLTVGMQARLTVTPG